MSLKPFDAQLARLPVTRLAEMLERREVTSVELVQNYQAAYHALNPLLNAVILADFDQALEEARHRDEERRQGMVRSRLHGIPFTAKESFDVAGWPTTLGDPAFRNNIATKDATVIHRLREAGAILMGKTNVPFNLRDWQSFNQIYGTTRNPWDLTRTPGGSSGGSAAAVAAGLTAFDIGSDIGSSLRNPAHYCGIYSHKSSHGLVSLKGHGINNEVIKPDINVAGPLARSAHDLECILAQMAGPDGAESRLTQYTLPPARQGTLRDFRVAVVLTDEVAPVDRSIQTALQQLGATLESHGAQVNFNARPNFASKDLWRVYLLLLRAATSKPVTDAAAAAAKDYLKEVSADDLSYPAMQAWGITLPHRDWLKLNDWRISFQAAWEAFFNEYDVLLCPAAASPAFRLNERGEPWQRNIDVNGEPQPTTTQLFWAGYSGVSYLPSTVAPIGFSSDGLPIGVQIVSRQYDDLTCLKFAQLLEQQVFAYHAPALDGPPP